VQLIRLWFPISPGYYFFDEKRFPQGFKSGNWPRKVDLDDATVSKLRKRRGESDYVYRERI
jgi:hypothetical protein